MIGFEFLILLNPYNNPSGYIRDRTYNENVHQQFN